MPQALLDDKIIRILTPFLALDQASLPEIDFDRWVANTTSERVAREVTEGAITLLKNTNDASRGLPMKGVRDIARESPRDPRCSRHDADAGSFFQSSDRRLLRPSSAGTTTCPCSGTSPGALMPA